MKRFQLRAGSLLAGMAVTAMPMIATAGITLYEEGEKSLEIGGRLQPQYRFVDADSDGQGSDSGDDFFLRRMRFYIEGTLTENIYGIWQVDFGDTSDDPEVKDAFIHYSGLPAGNIQVGNMNVPYSRELLTSSKRQQFVERTVVGDHNFGVPDRQMGILYNVAPSDLFEVSAGVFNAGLESDLDKVDFESRVSEDPDYFGKMFAGRIDFTPLGSFKLAQGAFGEETKFGVGLNGFYWENDDDAGFDGFDPGDSPEGEYDNVTGLGIDAAFRAGYFSADAAVQYTNAEVTNDTRDFLADNGAAAGTGFVNGDGEAEFMTYMIKGGYMIVPSKLEFTAGFSALDLDDGYRDTAGNVISDDMDKRYSAGLNYFFNKHNSKIQLTYEIGRDVLYANDANGQVVAPSNIGDDQNTLFLQFQQVL